MPKQPYGLFHFQLLIIEVQTAGTRVHLEKLAGRPNQALQKGPRCKQTTFEGTRAAVQLQCGTGEPESVGRQEGFQSDAARRQARQSELQARRRQEGGLGN